MVLPTPKNTSSGRSLANDGKVIKLFLTNGIHQIRFLQPLQEAHISYDHWLDRPNFRGLISCIEQDESNRFHEDGAVCPICEANRNIMAEANNNWDEAIKRGLNRPYPNYHINVLDKTLVKVHPNSERQYENKAVDHVWPSKDAKEKHLSLDEINPVPSNTVKIFTGSQTLFQNIADIYLATGDYYEKSEEGFCLSCMSFSTVRDTNCPQCGQPLKYQNFTVPYDIRSYDYNVSVSRPGGKRVTTPIPMVATRGEIAEGYDLYDLGKIATMQLSSEELRLMLGGVALKDIFSARGQDDREVKSSNLVTSEEEKHVKKVADELEDDVMDILG